MTELKTTPHYNAEFYRALDLTADVSNSDCVGRLTALAPAVSLAVTLRRSLQHRSRA